jgi:predicted nucleic acid-binding protein
LEQPIPILDGILAATARVHGLTMVSRDEESFRNTGVTVINPFAKPKAKGN